VSEWSKAIPDSPQRWTQFESETLEKLRDARRALASASGLAMADGMTAWSLRAHELAREVEKLTKEIADNQAQNFLKGCR
jgi:hypothetical protein